MLFDVRENSPVPIYEQIVSQIIFGIASGTVVAGELIPSVRELAVRLTVHPNTVARAFQELEREGVLAAKRGRGMEVTAEAASLCRDRRRQIVQSRIRDALREAVSSALEPEAIRKLVDEELHRANGYMRKHSGGKEGT
jgi:GntR family transcriptional regulator